MTNVTFYERWQVNMLSCRKHFAIIVIHGLRAPAIDINSSTVSRHINGPGKHASRTYSRLRCHSGRDVIITPRRASPRSSAPFSTCSAISTESGFHQVTSVSVSFNVLMCWRRPSSVLHLPMRFDWNMSVTLIQFIHAFSGETM